MLGVGLTCSLLVDATKILAVQYGYEVLMGLGFGAGLSTLLTLARLVVDEWNLRISLSYVDYLSKMLTESSGDNGSTNPSPCPRWNNIFSNMVFQFTPSPLYNA